MHGIYSFLLERLLTVDSQFNLLRHGSSQLVGSVASVFTLKRDKMLVEKHEGAICVVCCDVGRDKFFAIFCPSVPVEKYTAGCHQSIE